MVGLPLVHVARGIDPKTGFFRVAKGIIAIGGIGVGLVAICGLAFGLITIGGVSVGLLFALGGVAFSLMYDIGRLALAPHIITDNHVDEAFLQMIERWLPFKTTH